MKVSEFIPEWSAFFFRITSGPNAGWWFSPDEYHRTDYLTWSHDSDFPIRVDDAFASGTEREMRAMLLTCLLGEWRSQGIARQDPHVGRAIQSLVVMIEQNQRKEEIKL